MSDQHLQDIEDRGRGFSATATRPARARKPSTPATVRILDLDGGIYKVLSSDGTSWYIVNAAAGTCTCTAAGYGRTCRHLRSAVAVMDLHRSLRMGRQQQVRLSGGTPVVSPRPTLTLQTCNGCGAQFWGVASRNWCSCHPQATPPILAAARRGDAGLLEAFGVEL